MVTGDAVVEASAGSYVMALGGNGPAALTMIRSEVIVLETNSYPFLTSLIEESFERKGAYLAYAFSPPDAKESARAIVDAMKEFQTVAFSVVNSRGHPLNSPVACCFRNEHFYVPCTMTSLKAKCIQKNPAVSMTYFSGNAFALIVHGQAEVIRSGTTTFDEVDDLLIRGTGESVTTWEGTGVYLALSPSRVLIHGEIQ